MKRLWGMAVLTVCLLLTGCSRTSTPAPDATANREAGLLAECPGGSVQGCITQADALSDRGAANRDDARALHLYGIACELKEGYGCLRAGQLVDSGEVGKSDPQKALALYRQGCALENKAACGSVAIREKLEGMRNPRRRTPKEEGVPPGRTPTHAELQGTWVVDCERTFSLQGRSWTPEERASFVELCVNAAQRYIITQDTLEIVSTVKGKTNTRGATYTYEDGELRALVGKQQMRVNIPAELRGDTLLLMDGLAGGATALKRP